MAELSAALIRQVVFAMENQEARHLFDRERGQLVPADAVPPDQQPPETHHDPDARYAALPRWTSADGFHLMTRFVADLRNPTARRALQEILDSGQRVFRRFKDALREYPAVDRRFQQFKFREMRLVIAEWYATVMELDSADAVELGADEELDELVASDFEIVVMDPVPSALIEQLDRQAYHEAYGDEGHAIVHQRYRRRIARLPSVSDPRSTIYAAQTLTGDLCGFLWMAAEPLPDGTRVHALAQVTVLREYRGLGVATKLVATALDAVPSGEHVSVVFPAAIGGIGSLVERYGLVPRATMRSGAVSRPEAL